MKYNWLGMKKEVRGKIDRLWVVLLTGVLLLSACSAGDDVAFDKSIVQEGSIEQSVFDGEWTVNKQVVDTARLEVSGIFRLRLPEKYLTGLCFQGNENDVAPIIEPKGVPVDIQFFSQGYSENTQYSVMYASGKNTINSSFFQFGAFYVTVNGTDYRVELLSDDNGSAFYRTDTGLWTLGLTVCRFVVVNQDTQESAEVPLSAAVTLFYNAKKRIR